MTPDRIRPSCEASGRPSTTELRDNRLTDPVRIEGVHWSDHGFDRGCVECLRKADTQCSFHPSSQSKVYYRLLVLIRQGDVLFDEIAATILGTPASEYGSLDVSGRRKLVDSVVGLNLLLKVVKTVKNGFTKNKSCTYYLS